MPITDAKLKAARKKAAEKGQWALVAALESLILDTTDLDARINVLGAMHEVGLLSNSLAPYWDEWRTTAADHRLWADRCLDRLHVVDADYWAIVGLLALPLSAVAAAMIQRSYKLLGVRFANSHKEGSSHIASFAGKYQGRVLAPVIELGWDGEHRLIEVSRWRAVILDQQSEIDGSLVGHGGGSYFMRAKLPYGCWRIHDETFTLKEDWMRTGWFRRLRRLLQNTHDRAVPTSVGECPKRRQATARRLSVVSATSCARRRLIRSV